MKKIKQNKSMLAFLGVLLLLVVSLCVSVLIPSVFASTAVSIENNGSRLVAKSNGAPTSYQWMIADTVDGTFSVIDGADGKYYDITANDEGKYIKAVIDSIETEAVGPIGKLITMDIGKGAISLGTTYSGKDSNGNSVSGTHTATNIYVILHKENGTKTENNIVFSGNLPNAPFDVTLAGVNMGGTPTNHNQAPGNSGSNTPSTGEIRIPATSSAVKKVTLRLRDENIVRYISYYNGSDTNTPAKVTSSLKITDINGDGEVEGGCLYVPVKLAPEEIEAFVNSKTNYNHWNAGIGGTDGNSLVQNLHIAGGKIQVVTTLGDNCTAIGAGGNGYCQMEISGGEVIAHCNGTGAAIGGGIGWNAAAGKADILISGGKIYAENHARITAAKDGINHTVGGVAIGSGSTFHSSGSDGTVTITGGEVEAYGAYGNGIGGGNSSSYAGGGATINITGGTVKANSIGGGNSAKGAGGDATITIDNDANVRLTKEGTDCDFCGIGGGNSLSGNGGTATITVKSGTINSDGSIGGGAGGGTGNGGDATVNIYGGNLTAASIGGGTGSVGGHGGAAIVEVTDGFIETGSIGGGKTNNPNGQLGYAKATIKGGDIIGQFLMAAGGTEPCSFTMAGGVLHGVDTRNAVYTQKDGAAVYMDDPYGVVNISGGAIKDCSAQNGGAIYMSAGTCTISGAASIENCTSTENGGAIYMGGGTMTVNGGRIHNNSAELNGGAVYLGGGEMTVFAGAISANKAKDNGGGAYIDGGNVTVAGGSIVGNIATNNGGGIAVNDGNYSMVGGNVDGNTAVNGNGGGIYVSANESNVEVGIYSGSVSSNTSGANGGALAVVGRQDGTKEIFVQIGVDVHHFDESGNIVCNHDETNVIDSNVVACPQVNGNHASASGGGVFVTGNKKTQLHIYCLTEDETNQNSADDDAGQSNFMKMEGGMVTITTSNSNNMDKDNLETQDAHHGNTRINSTLYVTGGNMELWGEMTNPSISDVITVDITKEGDDFHDYRLNTNEKKYYKLKYFENFKDPVTGIVTGQYKEYIIAHDELVTISGNIYSHPGYTIKGWNTKNGYPKENLDNHKQKDYPTQNTGWYDVGLDYLFNNSPIGDLEIYAIWDANGYTVVYDPNSNSYTGEMANDAFYYNQENKLKKNAYQRIGYDFIGWSTDKELTASSVIYQDQQGVINLTNEKGAVVILYAQWAECNHDKQTHTYTYSVVDDGRTLKRDCSCGTYSEEVRLLAENFVYDKNNHPASVEYTTASWMPSVTYEALDGDALVNDLPYYAGTYRASVTVDGFTASVTYTIEKAEQTAPPKPEYNTELVSGGSVLSVIPVGPSPLVESDPGGYDSVIQYKLVYYIGGVQHTVVKETAQNPSELIDGKYAVQFHVDVVLTNYYVYVAYSEGANYKSSADISADSVYFFAGENVEIIVNNPDGILKELTMAEGGGEGIVENGARLSLSLLDNYYFPQGYDKGISVVTQRTAEGYEAYEVTFNAEIPCTEYTIQNIKDNTRIVITLPDVKRLLNLSGNITEGQNFNNITDSSATISRDSAYTVAFTIKNYDKTEYEVPVLCFDSALPANTTIILQDKTRGGYYWASIRNTGTTELKLTNFVRLGDANKTPFALKNGTMKLQLVVDFSQTENGMSGNAVKTTLSVAAKPASNAHIETSNRSANLKNVDPFTLTAQDDGVLTFRRNASDGFASKWLNRDSALVFIPNTALPADAHLQFVCGDLTEIIYANCDGNFIYPMPKETEGTVTVFLLSSLLVNNTTTYSFDVKWLVAESQAEQSPMNASTVASAQFAISCIKESDVSLKITGDKKLYSVGETVKTAVSWEDLPQSHILEVVLMVKTGDGKYSSTGVTREIAFTEENGTRQIKISLAGNSAGSYCLQITAEQGLIRVAEARYYFIVE